MSLDICAIHVRQKQAMMTDGSIIPITNFIDHEGEESEPEDAVQFVAGPDGDGKWWTDCIESYNVPGEQHAPTLH
jgi:hypothetical protein